MAQNCCQNCACEIDEHSENFIANGDEIICEKCPSDEASDGPSDEASDGPSDEASDKCPICQSNELNFTTECNHKFCHQCVKKWCDIDSTCPICRRPIEADMRHRFARVIQKTWRGYISRKGISTVKAFVMNNLVEERFFLAKNWKYEGLCKDDPKLSLEYIEKHTPASLEWEALCCFHCDRVELLLRKKKYPSVSIYDHWYDIEDEMVCPECKCDYYPRCEWCDELFYDIDFINGSVEKTCCDSCERDIQRQQKRRKVVSA